MTTMIRVAAGAIAASALLTGALVWDAIRLGGLVPPPIGTRLDSALKRFRESEPPLDTLVFSQKETLERFQELYSAETFFNATNARGSRPLDCAALAKGQAAPSDPAQRKALAIAHSRCARGNGLDSALVEPPWMSPSGVSYAYEASRDLEPAKRSEFLRKNRSFLHILERAELPASVLSAQESALAQLSLTELALFNSGVPAFVTSRHLWTLESVFPGGDSYRRYRRQSFDKTLSGAGLKLAQGPCSIDERCASESERRSFAVAGAGVGALTTLLLSLGLAAGLLWQRRKWELRFAADRELIMQTLAHELRHPVTSLRLTVEALRDCYDALPDIAQGEFLRLSDQVAKLIRLTDVSRQYVRGTAAGGDVFQPRVQVIPSANDFALDACRNYLDRIEVQPAERDVPLETDPYWLAMSLTNLIKNALIHGAKPVRIEVVSSEDLCELRVRDAGPPIQNSFADLVSARPKNSREGLGLGLSLVARLMRAMGGELAYSSDPKYFVLKVKVPHAQTPSR